MSEAEIVDLRGAILEILRAVPGQRMLGAVLGNRLRSRTGLTIKDHGFASLADFARQHLHDEVSVVPGPADFVFQLLLPGAERSAAASPGHPNTGPTASGTGSQDLRKLWKNPRSPFTIRVRRSDGAVSTMARGAPVSDDEVDLVPPSAQDHKDIGRRFLSAHMPEAQRAPFAQQLDSPEGAWWETWDALFRDPGPNVRQAWLRFREIELFGLLDIALRAAGLTEEVARTAREAIDRSRVELRRNTAPPRDGDADELRQALRRTLGEMSEEDLRRVWVPAGLLYDALRRNR